MESENFYLFAAFGYCDDDANDEQDRIQQKINYSNNNKMITMTHILGGASRSTDVNNIKKKEKKN